MENVTTLIYSSLPNGNMLTGCSSRGDQIFIHQFVAVVSFLPRFEDEGLKLCSIDPQHPHIHSRMKICLETGKSFQQKPYLLVMKIANGSRSTGTNTLILVKQSKRS
jgi:hypothetical protein